MSDPTLWKQGDPERRKAENATDRKHFEIIARATQAGFSRHEKAKADAEAAEKARKPKGFLDWA